MKTTFRIYKARFGAMIGLGLIAGVAVGLAMFAFFLVVMTVIDEIHHHIVRSAPYVSISMVFLECAIMFGLAVLVSCWAGWWANLAFCAVAQGEYQGRRVLVGEAAKTGLTGLKSLIPLGVGLTVVLGFIVWGLMWWALDFAQKMMACQRSSCLDDAVNIIIVTVPVICLLSLATVVMSYILNVKWFLAFPVMVSEKTGIWHALSRSWTVTKGSGGIIFIIIFLAGVAVGVVNQIAVLPVTVLTPPLAGSSYNDLSFFFAQATPETLATGVIILVITVFALPILPIASQVVYQDRMRWAEPR